MRRGVSRLLFLTWATWPGAATADELVVRASGSCPSADQVRAELAPLLSRPSQDDRPPVVIEEVGPRNFVVEVGSEFKAFEDEAGDCRERARQAAVFAALIFEPPSFELDAPTPPPKPPPRAEAQPEPTPNDEVLASGMPLPLRFDLGVGALGGLLGRGDTDLVTPQLSLRARYGRPFGLHAGIGYALPRTLRIDATEVSMTIVPLDVGMHVEVLDGPLNILFDLGVGLPLFFVQSRRAEASDVQTRLGTSLRAGTTWSLPVSGDWLAFATLDAQFVLREYELVIEPGRSVATLPRLWLGGLLGLAWRG